MTTQEFNPLEDNLGDVVDNSFNAFTNAYIYKIGSEVYLAAYDPAFAEDALRTNIVASTTGDIAFTVQDVDGQPVSNLPVGVTGGPGAITDSSGSATVTVEAGTYLAYAGDERLNSSVNPTAGGTLNTTLQYGGCSITIEAPSGGGIEGLDVEVAGSTNTTSNDGTVRFTEAPTVSNNVKIENVVIADVFSPSEGEDVDVTITADKVAQVKCIDNTSGAEAEGVKCTYQNYPIEVETGNDGVANLPVFTSGIDVGNIVVADNSDRFYTSAIEDPFTVESGDVESISIVSNLTEKTR